MQLVFRINCFLIVILGLLANPVVFATSSVWEAEKNGNTVYLVGTAHLLKKEDFPLPTVFDIAFKNSEKILFETDIASLTDPQFQRRFLQAMFLPEGKSLDGMISTDTFSQLKQHADSREIPMQQLLPFKAGFVGISLSMVEAKRYGLKEAGVDQYYFGLATEKNKPIGFLETPQQQINFLANLGVGNEDEFIRYTLNDLKALPGQLDKLRDSWHKGNLQYMEQLLLQQMQQFPKMYQSLVVARNKAWMPIILALFNNKTTEAVFVGALHMAGKDGLLSLLQQNGVAIKQL